LLVDLVFDRLAAQRHLDDDVQVVGRVLAHRNGVDIHVVFSPWGGAMKGGSLLAPAALSFASGLLGAVGKSCRLFRLSRDQAGTGTELQKRNNAVKRAIPALAVIALSGLAVPAQAYDSAYTELDLDACPVIETYEVGADWLCEGYGGIAVLVSEGDLRFTVSYGKDAAAESAFGQGFGPFNDLGPRIEWLLEADG